MKTNIIVTLQIEAQHCWLEAKNKLPQMAFLSNYHRHIFHICAKKTVIHDDRDLEIIQFKREIICYLNDKYFSRPLNMCNFEGKSCEMLCRELQEYFDLEYISVLEDNECGGEIWK